MKNLFSVSAILVLVCIVGLALAKPDFVSLVNTHGKTFVLPAKVAEVADHVFSLGSALDPATGQMVSGYAIIHYKKEHAKGGNKKPKTSSTCFDFLARNAKWRAVEPWVLNASNLSGLNDAFIFENLSQDIAKWEDAADGVLHDSSSINILGAGTQTTDLLTADTSSPDGKNEVYFADISSPGAIGVTIIWGVFGGKPSSRVLVEWDQIYDDVDFDWSNSGATDKMDFESIATHELGHSVGMGDLYDAACSTETMYGYATNGETLKRTLNDGDIAGINILY